ncbi:hypothetical protein [Streptomyces sp. NPDC060022]|uniref:hypothetical protein n=1 Tax=Streptomyces sp. NPDC060022 TaxID=3347039 RepID=UPI00369AA40C
MVEEVHELVGLGHELGEDALLQGHDVARAATGRHPLLQLGEVVAELGDVLLLDADAGVGRLVLLEQLVVAELAEGLHDQGGLPVRAGLLGPATASGHADGQSTGERSGQGGPPDTCVHVAYLL